MSTLVKVVQFEIKNSSKLSLHSQIVLQTTSVKSMRRAYSVKRQGTSEDSTVPELYCKQLQNIWCLRVELELFSLVYILELCCKLQVSRVSPLTVFPY
jgi:hypothetical protein